MYDTPVLSAVALVTDFLASNPTSEQVIAYRFPELLQQRLHELLDLNGEDELTPEQEAELDEIIQMDEMVSLLKAKIRLAQHEK